MIPAAFEYRRASSAAEAVALVGEFGEDAKLLAGGHSLLPLMKSLNADPEMFSMLMSVSPSPRRSWRSHCRQSQGRR